MKRSATDSGVVAEIFAGRRKQRGINPATKNKLNGKIPWTWKSN